MQNLTCSLVALAILAAREGKFYDAARLLGQAAVSPDSERFLEDVLGHNLESRVLIDSCSSADSPLSDLSNAVRALSASLETAERKSGDDDDEVISVSYGDELQDLADSEALRQAYASDDSDNADDLDAEFGAGATDEDADDSEDEAAEMGATQDDESSIVTTSSGIRFKLS